MFHHRFSFAARVALALALILTLLPAPARAEWREATSEHFVVVSDGSERQLVQLSQRLEAVHWMLTQLTGTEPGGDSQRVRIVLVSTIEQVRRAHTGDSAGVAGFYRPELTGAIAVVPRNEGEFSTTILFHEYAHHFMLQYLQRVYPPWLVEGFAEFVSTASFEDAGKISIGRPANHRAAELAYEEWVRADILFARPSAEDERAGVASYGQYWLATHYFIMDGARRRQLNAFLNAWSSGTDYDAALRELAPDIEETDRALRAYLSRGRFAYSQIDLPATAMAPPVVRVMREGEGAIVQLGLLDRDSMDEEGRADFLARLGRVLSRFPNDPAVQMLRAQAAFDFGDWAGTIAAADIVLAAEPDNRRASVYRAWAAIRMRSNDDSDVSATEASALRRPIIAANRADPNDPLALVAFAESFPLLRQDSIRSARQAWVRASELVPQDDGLRMTAIMNLLNSDDFEPQRRNAVARVLLVPLAYSPHPSPMQAYCLHLMEWIDGGAIGEPPQPPSDGNAAPAGG